MHFDVIPSSVTMLNPPSMHLPYALTLRHLGTGRRYAFRQQPQVCYWNLLQLAAAFVRAEILEQVGLPRSTSMLPWSILTLPWTN